MNDLNQVRRRDFLKMGSLGSLGMLLPALSLGQTTKAILQNIEPLKITKIETVRFDKKLKVAERSIQWMWVRIHTDRGIIGTGETYPFNEANEAVIKDLEWHSWAGNLLGCNPLEI